MKTEISSVEKIIVLCFNDGKEIVLFEKRNGGQA